MWLRLKLKSLLAIWMLVLGMLPLSIALNPEGVESPSKFTTNSANRLSPEEKLELLEKAEWVNQLLTNEGLNQQLNGTVLIAQKGVILYTAANGYADYRAKTPIALESAFQLASVSKTFTAVAIMQLYEAGLLQFDDLVTKFLPDFPYKAVTIRMLLNHRSGLGNYMSLAGKYGHVKLPFTNHHMHQMFVKHRPKLNYPTNTRFEYSNTGYAYLAYLVEVISGLPFEVYVNNKIFAPLGMYSAYVFNANHPPQRPDAVKGHKTTKWLVQNENDWVLNGITGDKGVYANVNDLLLFDQALHHGNLLKPETKTLAFSPGSPEKKYEFANYGFGFRMKKINGKTIIYHNGWWGGFKAAFRHYIEDDITLIALTNIDKKFPTPWICEQKLIFAGNQAPADTELLSETE